MSIGQTQIDKTIRKLEEYFSALGDDEYSEYLQGICVMYESYGYCCTDEFKSALLREIEYHLNKLKTETKIVTVKETIEVERTKIVWNQDE